ncbi:hypothetical protein PSPO01_04395 [Paraphaeosphaeria sporulosa]
MLPTTPPSRLKARVFIDPTTPPRLQPNLSRNFIANHRDSSTIQHESIAFPQSTLEAINMHNNCPKCSASISEGTKTCVSCGSVRLFPSSMPCFALKY